jgi:hypothetical protein
MKVETGSQQQLLLDIPGQRRPEHHGKVGHSGSRNGMTNPQRARFTVELHRAGAKELHHGDCRGADEDAHKIGRQLGLWIVGHPPTASGLRAYCICDEMRETRTFLVRNRAIVLETELLIATPQGPERLRSGTWSTIRYARRLRVPLLIIHPDGTITSE